MKITRCLLAGAVVAAGLLPSTPAEAVNTCSAPQRVRYETPGFDTVLQVRICLTHGAPARGAYAHVSWIDGGDGSTDNNRKFDALDVHYELRIARQTVANGSCSLADRVNRNENGMFTCPTAYHESVREGAWSADGYIAYNLDRDGAGMLRTELESSPAVHE